MKKTEIKDVLNLIKEKLEKDPEASCGVLWNDDPVIYIMPPDEDPDGPIYILPPPQ